MQKGEQAHRWAEEIYCLSEKALMAHSIRAVEQYIEESIDNPQNRQPHRIKIRVASTHFYMHRRAMAVIHVGWSDILVAHESEIGFEEQRKAIAHELAHILFAKSVDGKNRIVTDRETESACVVFEKDLCLRHSKFYQDEKNVKRLQFHSLDSDA